MGPRTAGPRADQLRGVLTPFLPMTSVSLAWSAMNLNPFRVMPLAGVSSPYIQQLRSAGSRRTCSARCARSASTHHGQCRGQ